MAFAHKIEGDLLHFDGIGDNRNGGLRHNEQEPDTTRCSFRPQQCLHIRQGFAHVEGRSRRALCPN